MGRVRMIILCGNCLETGAAAYPVGAEFGSQRDPERHTVGLCVECIKALEAGNFELLNSRFIKDKEVTNLRHLYKLRQQ